MARKGKGFNIKRLFVDHGEKMVLAGILVMVVLALAGTSWLPYDKQPSQFTEKVENAEKAIEVTTWPDADRENFKLQEEALPARIVDKGINDRLQVTPLYLHSQSQLKDKDARDDPLQEPEFLPVVALIATDARVNIRQAPKFDETQDGTDGLNPDGTPLDPTKSPGEQEDDRPDEFRQSTGGLGYAGAATGGDEDMFGAGMIGMGRGRREDRDYGSMTAPELARGGRGGRANDAMMGGRGGRGRAVRGGDGRVADVDGAPTAGRGTRGRRNTAPARGGKGKADELRGRGALGATGLEAGDEDMGLGYGGYGGGYEQDGKGYPFVSVRGVFEFREQIRKYSEAIHKGRNEALMHFMIVDFKLERQRLISAPDTWTAWEPVNDQVFRDILKESDGFAPEVVSAAVTDSAITCPLPARLTGEYFKQATHPKLEKFTLSEEDMELELKYSRLLLEKALDQKKLPTGMIRKRGFNDMVFDANSVRQGVFGYQSPYAMGGGAMDEDDMMMSSMLAGGAGGGRGMGGNRGAMAGNRAAMGAQMNTTIDQLVMELAKETEQVDSPEATKKLKTFITQRAAPEGDLLLFRYFDFDVEPGESYRYRVQLVLQNPNFGQPLAATGGVASVVLGEDRTTPWSEPTAPITVDDTVKYFLTAVEPPKSLAYPDVRMNMFQYDQDVGTVVQQELNVSFGQNVGGKVKTEQADPAKGTIEEVDYAFKSEDILIDALPDVRISRTEHPDLQLPPDSRGLAQVAEVAAVVTPRGQIQTVDPVSQKDSFATAKKNKEYQDEQFEMFRSPTDAAGTGYEDLYGDLGGDEMEASMIKGLGGRNPLRKGRGGRGGGRN